MRAYGGELIRSVWCVLWLFSSITALGFEARVLIDDEATFKELRGHFNLCRLKQDEKNNWNCASHLSKFTLGHWRVAASEKGLNVVNLKTTEEVALKGDRFQLSGRFQLEKPYLKKMEIHWSDNKPLWIVHLAVDKYLYGVMASEVPASWPIESLKAQAIASRTYFLYKKIRRLTEAFDVRSDIMDQVFSLKSKKHKKIMQAVNKTHDWILVDKKTKKIFPAYFHADCGGHTSTEQQVWRLAASANRGVKDSVCRKAKKNNWSISIAKDVLMSHLQKMFFLPSGTKLKYVLPRVIKNNRAHFVDFIFSHNLYKRISANELRKVLGFAKLRSTHFKVENRWDRFIFSGRGFGHGVGMCQWGAQRWARRGRKFHQILRHYYPNSKLKKADTDDIGFLHTQLAI